MTLEEKVTQLERDVKSLQECIHNAHLEIASIKRQFNEEFMPSLGKALRKQEAPIGTMILR